VISSTSPHDHPARFIAALGAAYRASGRDDRIFDSFGHNAYPNRNDESPFALHTGSRSLDEGDYHELMRRLTRAFGGTHQPVPGEAKVRIWYLEDGFETTVPPEKRRAYSSREVASSLVEAAPAPHAARGRCGTRPGSCVTRSSSRTASPPLGRSSTSSSSTSAVLQAGSRVCCGLTGRGSPRSRRLRPRSTTC
jgi:hypothetical protein